MTHATILSGSNLCFAREELNKIKFVAWFRNMYIFTFETEDLTNTIFDGFINEPAIYLLSFVDCKNVSFLQ